MGNTRGRIAFGRVLGALLFGCGGKVIMFTGTIIIPPNHKYLWVHANEMTIFVMVKYNNYKTKSKLLMLKQVGCIDKHVRVIRMIIETISI